MPQWPRASGNCWRREGSCDIGAGSHLRPAQSSDREQRGHRQQPQMHAGEKDEKNDANTTWESAIAWSMDAGLESIKWGVESIALARQGKFRTC